MGEKRWGIHEQKIKWIKRDKAQIKAECRESIKRFELKDYIEKIEKLFDSVMRED